jgi:hypothetical protein
VIFLGDHRGLSGHDERDDENEEVAHLMAVRDDEVAARTARARAIGLFRYQLIRVIQNSG